MIAPTIPATSSSTTGAKFLLLVCPYTDIKGQSLLAVLNEPMISGKWIWTEWLDAEYINIRSYNADYLRSFLDINYKNTILPPHMAEMHLESAYILEYHIETITIQSFSLIEKEGVSA